MKNLLLYWKAFDEKKFPKAYRCCFVLFICSLDKLMNEILKWRVCRIIFINDTYLISYLRYSTHQQDLNHQWNLQKCALCCCRVNVTCMLCEQLLEGNNVECQFSYPNDIAIDNLNDRNILVMLIVWSHIVSNLTIWYLSIIRKGYVSNMHWYHWKIKYMIVSEYGYAN